MKFPPARKVVCTKNEKMFGFTFILISRVSLATGTSQTHDNKNTCKSNLISLAEIPPKSSECLLADNFLGYAFKALYFC